MIFQGLKTVIGELPPTSTALASNICKKITGRLTSAISKVNKLAKKKKKKNSSGPHASGLGQHELTMSFIESNLYCLRRFKLSFEL